MAEVVKEFLSGVGLLGRGLSLITRRPRLFLLGALPPLITSVLFTVIVVALFAEFGPLSHALTPFADGWGQTGEVIRTLVGIAFVAGLVLLMVISFTTLTLALGSPIYDRLSADVEREFGEVPTLEEPLARGLWRALRQSLALIAVSAVVGILLFAAGFIPVVGQTLVPVLSAMFGGWMLAIELVGGAFERRGLLRIADRRQALARRRARALGFAVPTFLLLAIPFAGAVVFPVATAGGTLLARQLLGQPDAPRSGVDQGP